MSALLPGAIAALLLAPVAARAHGDLESSKPPGGSTVGRVPGRVVLRLTEPPGPGSTMTVVDGCKRNVATRVVRSGSALIASVKKAEPGRWHARFRGVSSVDGHTTRGGVRFAVGGKRDCSKKTEDRLEIGGGDDTQIEAEAPDDQGGLPIVPIAVGSLILVGIALVLRRLSSG